MVYVPEEEMHDIFCTEYIHYRTKKLMRASDYGYKYWHFRARNKK